MVPFFFLVVLSTFKLSQRNHKQKERKRKKNLRTQISQTFRHDVIFLWCVYGVSCQQASPSVGRCYISEALTYRDRIKCIPLIRISSALLAAGGVWDAACARL